MVYKVAYMTPMGWFIYEDQLFSKKESADAFIENEPAEYKKRLFVVSYEGVKDEWQSLGKTKSGRYAADQK